MGRPSPWRRGSRRPPRETASLVRSGSIRFATNLDERKDCAYLRSPGDRIEAAPGGRLKLLPRSRRIAAPGWKGSALVASHNSDRALHTGLKMAGRVAGESKVTGPVEREGDRLGRPAR